LLICGKILPFLSDSATNADDALTARDPNGCGTYAALSSGGEASAAGVAGLAECHQHAEHFADLGCSGGAFESAGNVARGRGEGLRASAVRSAMN
jgi:hypothetical protein